MSPQAQPLPTRFPCWCKATYSWGGETKRDLGFIEGDLIECLNAGDGSWWMGRLRRDRRMVGLFPSNFVVLMPEDWSPAPMASSPQPSRQNSAITQPTQKQKGTRKPFQSYTKAMSPSPSKELLSRQGSQMDLLSAANASGGSVRKPLSPRPVEKRPSNGSSGTNSPAGTPSLRGGSFRAHSPAPSKFSQSASHSGAVSPSPYGSGFDQSAQRQHAASQVLGQYSGSQAPSKYTGSRAPSPNTHTTSQTQGPYGISRRPSSNPYGASQGPSQYEGSREPSPNPYTGSQGPSSGAYAQYRGHSPAPPVQYHDQQYHDHQTQDQQNHSHQQHDQQHHNQQFHHTQHMPHSRQPSPNPYKQHERSLTASPNPEWSQQAPPPPPPAHRYVNSRAPSPQPYTNGYHTPNPGASPRVGGATPSPIANAMNDVMNAIDDMGFAGEPTPQPEAPKEPPSVWSPEAFDELYANNLRQPRSQSSFQIREQSYDQPESKGFRSQAANAGVSDVGLSNVANAGASSTGASSIGASSVGNYVQRMEARLRQLHEQDGTLPGQSCSPERDQAPDPPPKHDGYENRPKSSMSMSSAKGSKRGLRHVKSGFDLGRQALGRTFTLKSNSTTTTDSSNHTLMSGTSAGGFSATSAGSFYRRGMAKTAERRPRSVMDTRPTAASVFANRPTTPSVATGISYHYSHGSHEAPGTSANSAPPGFYDHAGNGAGILGGLATPNKSSRKSGFFKKMLDTAKTGAANARSTISSGSRPASRAGRPPSRAGSPTKMTGFAGGLAVTGTPVRPQSAAAFSRPQSSMGSAAKEMGLGSAIDWVQVRRDVNRSNSISRNERVERAERCEMLDLVVMQPTDELEAAVDGDEGADSLPITDPVDFQRCGNLALVDKAARFVNVGNRGLTVAGLTQGYLCRPYRSDVQRLRAVFTWVCERVAWEDFEIPEGEYVDTRRMLSQQRGCSQEIAYLVAEMCASVGIHAEVIRGYLKTPGELIDFDNAGRPNHWWNAVIVDGEWRIMDCALASPTCTRRKLYSSQSSSVAESFYFLARPLQICYTHVPLLPEQQHIVPPVAVEILMALPAACPGYFRNELAMSEYCTSLVHLENLEVAQIQISVPDDIECVAETEVRAFARDADGDFFESGDVVRSAGLAQAEWVAGRKRFTIKALLPGDEGQGVLKIYAGKRGLMHSIKSNPHALALALPLTHSGTNPPYDFFTRHPTPHAQRHDLYVVQPQCARLVANNTFIFSVRQHPSTLTLASPALSGVSAGITFSSANGGRISPNPFARPASAMSMSSVSHSGSNYSSSSSIPSSSSSAVSSSSGAAGSSQWKPAKLAVQSPAGKIIRLTRKTEANSLTGGSSGRGEPREGTEWETVIKVGERGVWRGLVLADRSARWCVFAEWECV